MKLVAERRRDRETTQSKVGCTARGDESYIFYGRKCHIFTEEDGQKSMIPVRLRGHWDYNSWQVQWLLLLCHAGSTVVPTRAASFVLLRAFICVGPAPSYERDIYDRYLEFSFRPLCIFNIFKVHLYVVA
jgi:hypothetical protein